MKRSTKYYITILILCINWAVTFAYDYRFPEADTFLVFDIKKVFLLFVLPILRLVFAYILASLLLEKRISSRRTTLAVLAGTTVFFIGFALIYSNLTLVMPHEIAGMLYPSIEALRATLYLWIPYIVGIYLAHNQM